MPSLSRISGVFRRYLAASFPTWNRNIRNFGCPAPPRVHSNPTPTEITIFRTGECNAPVPRDVDTAHENLAEKSSDGNPVDNGNGNRRLLHPESNRTCRTCIPPKLLSVRGM
eukprot:scaffold4510_cov183-Amphora_coffeaeformis.AAC.7